MRRLDMKDIGTYPGDMETDLDKETLLDPRIHRLDGYPSPRFVVWRAMPGAGPEAGFWEAKWDLSDGDTYLEIADLPKPYEGGA